MPVEILANILLRQHTLSQPAATLAGSVEGYYWHTITVSGRLWAALDGQPSLVFVLNAPYTVIFSGKHSITFNGAFYVCGQLEHTYITHSGLRLLVVRLKAALPGVHGPLCDIEDLWGMDGSQLAAAVCKADQPEQTALLDAFLEEELHNTYNYKLEEAVQLIRREQGQLSIHELCSQLKINYKWLQRSFKQQLGIAPKAYIDSIRFLYACFRMEQDRNLTSVALSSGYYDQAHFTKACKRFTGVAPNEYKKAPGSWPRAKKNI
jgi:AraC-like DNA-binding protein